MWIKIWGVSGGTLKPSKVDGMEENRSRLIYPSIYMHWLYMFGNAKNVRMLSVDISKEYHGIEIEQKEIDVN